MSGRNKLWELTREVNQLELHLVCCFYAVKDVCDYFLWDSKRRDGLSWNVYNVRCVDV